VPRSLKTGDASSRDRGRAPLGRDEAGTLNAHQAATVADLAREWIESPWPTTSAAVSEAEKLLAEARELIELRDQARAVASQ
jgi:hypothetical protein